MKTFTHEHFGKLIAVREDNDNWFSMSSISTSLEIEDGIEKFAQLDDSEKRLIEMPKCKIKKASFINQFGLSHVVADIHTKEAIDYQKWVLTEVVPQLEDEVEPEPEPKNDNLSVFESPEFGQLRTIVEGDKVLYCASDVAKALGYTNPRKAVNDHCRYVTKRDAPTDCTNPHGAHYILYKSLSFIPEGDVYRLITRSKLPSAEKFERWVFDEVLPSVRKHGAYMTPDTLENFITNPEFGIRLLTELKNEQDRRREAEKKNAILTQENTALSTENAIMKPKASYYDIVLQCPSLLTITQIAKDYGMSGTHMNSILCELGVQYKSGKVWLLYQKYAGCGYVQSATAVYTEWDGMLNASTYTKWTQKGRLFIYNLLKEHGVLPLIERENESIE